jgi:hypothetical protein
MQGSRAPNYPWMILKLSILLIKNSISNLKYD